VDKSNVEVRMNNNLKIEWAFDAVDKIVSDFKHLIARKSVLLLEILEDLLVLFLSAHRREISFKCGFALGDLITVDNKSGNMLTRQRPSIGIDEEEAGGAGNDVNGVIVSLD